MDRPPGRAREDRGLLRRIADGDARALADLYDRHAERLFAHALWITRRRQDAEDVVQTVFVKLAGLGGALLGVRSPSSYLHRMTRAAAIDGLRRSRRRREEPIDEAELLAIEPGEGDDDARTVARNVAALPVEQREVLSLHLFEGLTFREIGTMTGVSRFTAASRYRLALDRLRRELGEA